MKNIVCEEAKALGKIREVGGYLTERWEKKEMPDWGSPKGWKGGLGKTVLLWKSALISLLVWERGFEKKMCPGLNYIPIHLRVKVVLLHTWMLPSLEGKDLPSDRGKICRIRRKTTKLKRKKKKKRQYWPGKTTPRKDYFLSDFCNAAWKYQKSVKVSCGGEEETWHICHVTQSPHRMKHQ